MPYHFRKAEQDDASSIWNLLAKAIERRKLDGSNQWQDGYPNPQVLQQDLLKESGYIMTFQDEIIGYCSIMINDEPAYKGIEGKWLTEGDFVVIHRIALDERYLGQGLSQKLLQFLEDFAIQRNIFSCKADTNFDNFAMMHIFEKMGYQYCGEVYFRGSARRAYEKVLNRI